MSSMSQEADVAGLLTEHDLYLLAEGTFERPWERLGAHFVTVQGRPGVRFAVWAPEALDVSVVGDHNGWQPGATPMTRRGSTGFWEAFVPGLAPGARYKYHVVRSHGLPAVDKADPYAFAAEPPPRMASPIPGSASVVYDLSGYAWGDAAWLAERPARQRQDQPLSIYEVHAGSWRRAPDQGNRWLTYRELAHQLVPYVKAMGYTHVELLPITEYPFDQSWGYQVTGYFAPTARYGTPHDFMYFVEYCHQHGLGVILDWVPAHFAKEEHGLGLFDGSHLYEHADPRIGEHPEWGTYIFNYARAEVRSFLLASARFWLELYHVDGFRVDAVAAMIWLDHARPPSHWGANRYGGRDNLDAVDFLQRFNRLVHETHPGVITIAEESTSYNWVTEWRDTTAGQSAPSPQQSPQGGSDPAEAPARSHTLGFDYKWNLGWMHDTLDYFEEDPIRRKGFHQLLTFPIWYAFDERYLLPLSHDEVVHLKKALLTKMPGEDWQRFANLRALLSYQTAHPGKKLLFMGGEFGQWAEWNENRSLDWHLVAPEVGPGRAEFGPFPWAPDGGEPRRIGKQESLHRGLQRCVADLNRLYATDPALHALDSRPRGFDWVDHQDADRSVISFLRRGRQAGQVVVVVCNFTPVVREQHPVGVPIPGPWHEVHNSDDRRYGGSGIANGTVQANFYAPEGRRSGGGIRYGQRLLLTLPPLAVLFLKPGSAPTHE